MTRRIPLVTWLALLWVLLWRDLTVANMVSGVVVAVAVSTLFAVPRLGESEHRVKPMAVVTLLGYFSWKLVQANVVLAREVLTRRDTTRTGIIAVRLGPASDIVTTIIANAVSLTPGTLTLETRPDPRTLYVHVLHLHDVERARSDIHRLEQLIRRANGYDDGAVGSGKHRAAGQP